MHKHLIPAAAIFALVAGPALAQDPATSPDSSPEGTTMEEQLPAAGTAGTSYGASTMTGVSVVSPDGTEVGTVSDIVINSTTYGVDGFVVTGAGGTVLVPATAISSDAQGNLIVNLTADEISGLPQYFPTAERGGTVPGESEGPADVDAGGEAEGGASID